MYVIGLFSLLHSTINIGTLTKYACLMFDCVATTMTLIQKQMIQLNDKGGRCIELEVSHLTKQILCSRSGMSNTMGRLKDKRLYRGSSHGWENHNRLPLLIPSFSSSKIHFSFLCSLISTHKCEFQRKTFSIYFIEM
jgi:hypothetical protein